MEQNTSITHCLRFVENYFFGNLVFTFGIDYEVNFFQASLTSVHFALFTEVLVTQRLCAVNINTTVKSAGASRKHTNGNVVSSELKQ